MSNNPQAFPYGDHVNGGAQGMTLRDYFAGQALTALVASAATQPRPIGVADKIANDAYRIADAMLPERHKATCDGEGV